MPKDVQMYGEMDDSGLQIEKERFEEWKRRTFSWSLYGVVGLIGGFVTGVNLGNPYVTVGSAGLIIPLGQGKSAVGSALDRRIQVIQDEIHSRA